MTNSKLKVTIRKCIENFQIGLIKELEDQFNDKKEASDIDENDVRDADTHSHQSQAQSEEQRVNDRLVTAKADLEYVQKIPLNISDSVVEGALIETKSLLIYVGIITQKFTEEGRDIIGISIKAPIYKTLFNQKIGFPFQFSGIDCEILSIH
jgi:hypothetical protein